MPQPTHWHELGPVGPFFNIMDMLDITLYFLRCVIKDDHLQPAAAAFSRKPETCKYLFYHFMNACSTYRSEESITLFELQFSKKLCWINKSKAASARPVMCLFSFACHFVLPSQKMIVIHCSNSDFSLDRLPNLKLGEIPGIISPGHLHFFYACSWRTLVEAFE